MLDLEKQLKKGVLEILILRLFQESPHYGYQLIQELRDRSGGFFVLKEGTLYPILYRLEDANWIESYWVEAEGRSVPKKYYRITESGRIQAEVSSRLLVNLCDAVGILLNGENQ